jgi:SEC-C motif
MASSADANSLNTSGEIQLRNAPCPCGSGRRFKHCHGQLTGAESASEADAVDFVIAGAQRAGTTALDLYMREHSRVAMATTRKELHFFDHEEHFRTELVDYAAYHANFAPRMPQQLRGDATPSYMYWEPAAARMAPITRR